jgi:hypothetical protein
MQPRAYHRVMAPVGRSKSFSMVVSFVPVGETLQHSLIKNDATGSGNGARIGEGLGLRDRELLHEDFLLQNGFFLCRVIEG